jgi:hypothetical protein
VFELDLTCTQFSGLYARLGEAIPEEEEEEEAMCRDAGWGEVGQKRQRQEIILPEHIPQVPS